MQSKRMETQKIIGTASALPIHGAGRRPWLAIVAAVGGGATIIAGTLLPWLTLFAGLYPYRGIIGWNGRLLLMGGVLAVAGGVWLLVRDTPALRRAIGALGLVLLASAAWLLLQQYSMYHELIASHPMTVPGVGPGLYVAAAGALLVALTLIGAPNDEPA